MTMARSMSAIACRPGPRRTAYVWTTFSLASRSKTPLWNATTAPCATTGWDSTCLRTLRRSETSPPSGSGLTTTNAPLWTSAEAETENGRRTYFSDSLRRVGLPFSITQPLKASIPQKRNCCTSITKGWLVIHVNTYPRIPYDSPAKNLFCC